MINELEVVVLAGDLPEYGLKAGNDGTVVHVFGDGAAYLAEFMTPEGDTIDVVEVEPHKLRPSDDKVYGVNPASLPDSSGD